MNRDTIYFTKGKLLAAQLIIEGMVTFFRDQPFSKHIQEAIYSLNRAEAELDKEVQQPNNTGSPKLMELINELKSVPTISTTHVLKVLYSEFPKLKAGTQ